MERVVNFPSLTTKNNIILVHMMDLTATCGVPLRVTSTKMASGEGADTEIFHSIYNLKN